MVEGAELAAVAAIGGAVTRDLGDELDPLGPGRRRDQELVPEHVVVGVPAVVAVDDQGLAGDRSQAVFGAAEAQVDRVFVGVGADVVVAVSRDEGQLAALGQGQQLGRDVDQPATRRAVGRDPLDDSPLVRLGAVGRGAQPDRRDRVPLATGDSIRMAGARAVDAQIDGQAIVLGDRRGVGQGPGEGLAAFDLDALGDPMHEHLAAGLLGLELGIERVLGVVVLGPIAGLLEQRRPGAVVDRDVVTLADALVTIDGEVGLVGVAGHDPGDQRNVEPRREHVVELVGSRVVDLGSELGQASLDLLGDLADDRLAHVEVVIDDRVDEPVVGVGIAVVDQQIDRRAPPVARVEHEDVVLAAGPKAAERLRTAELLDREVGREQVVADLARARVEGARRDAIEALDVAVPIAGLGPRVGARARVAARAGASAGVRAGDLVIGLGVALDLDRAAADQADQREIREESELPRLRASIVSHLAMMAGFAGSTCLNSASPCATEVSQPGVCGGSVGFRRCGNVLRGATRPLATAGTQLPGHGSSLDHRLII